MAVENANPKRNSIFSKIIQIVAAILVVTVFTAGVSVFVVKKITQQGVNKENGSPRNSITYPAGDFLTNLSDKGYIKFSMVYHLSNKDVQDEIDEKESEIRDAILSILRGKRFSEVKDSQGMENLRENIKNNVNEIIETGEIQDIFFTSIIVN